MNSKKLLSMLLVSLGVFSLGLTSCGELNPSSEPSTTPSETPSAVESAAPSEEKSDVLSSETSEDPTSDVSEEPSTDDKSEDPSSEPSPSVSDEPSTDDPSSESSEVLPDGRIPDAHNDLATKYEVEFNYNDPLSSLTVWTDYAINGTVAPYINNISEQEDNVNRRTAPFEAKNPYATGTYGNGMYFFAVDADGYIVYASYGLGSGFGSPCDGYYHNQNTKDIFDAPYWSIHDEYDFYPAKTDDGRSAWTLFDLMIPEGGFVVKGYYTNKTMEAFWKQITGMTTCPTGNSQLEGNTAPKALDKWYLSIDENRQLSVRERQADDEETPSRRGGYNEADEPIEYAALTDVRLLEDNATVEGAKGVITYKNGNEVIIVDEDGVAVMVFDALMADFAIGDTVVVDGVKVTYAGDVELKSLTRAEKIEKYGSVSVPAVTVVDETNLEDALLASNNYQSFKLVGAVVKSIAPSAKSVVTIGETEITLYKAAFPEDVAVGDTVDIYCTMVCYNASVQFKLSTADDRFVRYSNITVDVDGVGALEATTTAHPNGSTVTLTAENDDPNSTFQHWEVLTTGEDGTETWVKVENSDGKVSIAVTVESDANYRAVYDVAPWNALAAGYVNTTTIEVGALYTDSTFVLDSSDTAGTGASSVDWKWKYVLIADAEGRVCYANAYYANGWLYGDPNPVTGNRYFVDPLYEDYNNNPAVVAGEGSAFKLVIPEGGFAYVGGAGRDEIIAALTGGKVTAVNDDTQAACNNRENFVGDVRVFNDSKGGLKVFVNEVKEGTFNGAMNAADDTLPTVYTSDYEGTVALGDFTVAVDENGIVIFASRTSSGYGGPADGFYHDGTYVAVAGETHGIFALNEKFAGWPNTVEIDGEVVNAWSLYTVVVPEGGAIITGSAAQMEAFILTLFPEFVTGGNWLEGSGAPDGALNEELTVKVTLNSKFANFETVLNTPVDPNAPDFVMSLNGADSAATVYTASHEGAVALGDFTVAVDANGKVIFASRTSPGYGGPADGFYHDGTYACVAGETHGIFALDAQFAGYPNKLEDGTPAWSLYTVVVPEDGAIITGSGSAMVEFMTLLFPEFVESKNWLESAAKGLINDVVVNVEAVEEAANIKVEFPVPNIDQIGNAFTLGYAANTVGTWDTEKGAWVGTFTLSDWGSVSFTFTNADGEEVLLTHENTTFAGEVIQEDPTKFGCYAGRALYIEEDFEAGQFMSYNGGETRTYKFEFDPETMTLTVK